MTADWPTRTCSLPGPSLGTNRPKVVWKEKHEVWFFVAWEQPIQRLGEWGDTLPAFERMCRHLNYTVTWPDGTPLSTSQSATCTRGQVQELSGNALQVRE